MSRASVRVYCAGPLFNAKERDEMGELAECLEDAGFLTFLPQRDGLELAGVIESLEEIGVDPARATDLASKAIFALDVFQVVEQCDAVVVNLNGRVPDEGSVSEAAIAWCHGKALVGYKADSRAAFQGRDNPLVTGLFDFEICDSLPAVVARVQEGLAQGARRNRSEARSRQIAAHLELGLRLWEMSDFKRHPRRLAELLAKEFPLSDRLPGEPRLDSPCAEGGAYAFQEPGSEKGS
jgi:nucleoside 2-deoxyribosyltransferase